MATIGLDGRADKYDPDVYDPDVVSCPDLPARCPTERAWPHPDQFIGKDEKIIAIRDLVVRVADTDATVLITGESGTGKECVARSLHRLSSRRDRPFVAVNSGAVADGLLESELFGHARGAFTGAESRRVGLFEAADGGTLFLDEIAEMSKSFQVKLLRVLQSGEYTPVGLSEVRSCDVRIVAASNRDLHGLVEEGVLRQDLYYRINVINLKIMPLRERRNDIPLLIDHFLRKFGLEYGKPGLRLGDAAAQALLRHDYPGNVRELENIIRRAVVLCRPPIVTVADLCPDIVNGRHARLPEPPGSSFHEAKAHAIEQFERTYLTTVLLECGGIISRAATRSGLSERNFHEKLKKYGISGKEFRAAIAPGRGSR